MSALREILQILPQRARIVADDCIGCAKCLDACPVDAIIGAPRQLHVVIIEQCTGCELCIPPCPVDCIELESVHREAESTQQLAARATFYAQRKIERLTRTVNAHPQAELTEIDTLNRAQAASAVAEVMARTQAQRA